MLLTVIFFPFSSSYIQEDPDKPHSPCRWYHSIGLCRVW